MNTETTRERKTEARSRTWRCGQRTLPVDGPTLIMGILNLTPDSFSDGGAYPNGAEAVGRALAMIDEGADIIDLGGESTRPGAEAVDADVEIRRTAPVMEALRDRTEAVLSIDTTKAEVARRALEAGADVINDVSALTRDPEMREVLAGCAAGVVLMHMRGEPRTMQADPCYADVVADVADYLRTRREDCLASGIEADRIVLDPGIGFGKTLEHNLDLLRGLPILSRMGQPLLVGVSRKSFLGAVTGRKVGDRLAAGLGAHAFAALNGANILRVHDVKETCDAVRIVDILRNRQS